MTQLRDLSLTSDKDYLKIINDGFVTISANATPDADSTFPADLTAPFGLAGSLIIPHSLGYVPLVRCSWDSQNNGLWRNLRYNSNVDPWLKIISTSTYVKLMMNTDGAAKNNIPVYYRIYDTGNVAANSDSGLDKIFLKQATSAQVPLSSGSITESQVVLAINHGGGDLLAPNFTIEFSQDQVNWYQEGMLIQGPWDTSSGPPGGPYARFYYTTAWGEINKDQLFLHLISNYPSNVTVYVRFAVDYKV